jgi:tetratricopeptide (TPR) repeat protein
MWAAAALFLALRMAALGGMKAAGATLEQRLLAIRNLPVLLLDGVRAMLAMQPIGPRHLSYDYAHLDWTWSILAGVVVVALTAGAWYLRRSYPLLLVAWAVTGAMLLPAVMVTTVPGWGGFARYLYVPWAFVALALTQGGCVLFSWLAAQRRHLVPVALLLLIGYATAQQIGLRQALYAYSSQEGLARTSIAIAPHVPEGYEWLGNVYLMQNDLRLALHYYQEALQRAPHLYRPRNNVAACLVRLGRPAEALSHLATLEQEHGITTRSSINTVQALILLRRWDEAGERLLWILRREPRHPALLDLQRQLLHDHPHRDRYRAWLRVQLTRPENRDLVATITPLLAAPATY